MLLRASTLGADLCRRQCGCAGCTGAGWTGTSLALLKEGFYDQFIWSWSPPPEPESEQSAGHQIELYMLNGAQRWCDVAAVLQCAASCAVFALQVKGAREIQSVRQTPHTAVWGEEVIVSEPVPLAGDLPLLLPSGWPECQSS